MRKAEAKGLVETDLLERRDDALVRRIEPVDLERLLEDVIDGVPRMQGAVRVLEHHLHLAPECQAALLALGLAGHRCLYVPEAIVHHVGSIARGRRSDFTVYHGHRNLVWTFWKNMPGPLLAAYWPQHLTLNAASLVHFTARGQGRAILRAKRDAWRGLPRILRARRLVQARRRAGSREMRRLMVGGLRSLGIRRLG